MGNGYLHIFVRIIKIIIYVIIEMYHFCMLVFLLFFFFFVVVVVVVAISWAAPAAYGGSQARG